MKRRFIVQFSVLVVLFIIALVLEIAPWPANLQSFKPSWLVLALMFWTISMPTKINIGSAFILGVIWDLVLGSVLGMHALILSLFSYIVARNNVLIRNLSLWFQSVLAIVFVAGIRLCLFILEWIIHGNASFHWQELFGALISGILWPWVFLLLRKIQQQFQLQ